MGARDVEAGAGGEVFEGLGDEVMRLVPLSVLKMRRLLDAGRKDTITSADRVPEVARRDDVRRKLCLGRRQRRKKSFGGNL